MGEAGHCLKFKWLRYINILADQPLARSGEWSGVVTGKEDHIVMLGLVSNMCIQRVAIVSCRICSPIMRKWSWSDEGITAVYPAQNISVSGYDALPHRYGEWAFSGSVYLACFMKDGEINPRTAVREVEDGLVCKGDRSSRDKIKITVQPGIHIFHVPERNFLAGKDDLHRVRSIPGLPSNSSMANFYITAEEIAQNVNSYQVADGELKADIAWLVEFLDEKELSRLHAPDEVTSDLWHQRGRMENSVVGRYEETDLYKVHAEDSESFWTLTRMPPSPDQEFPSKLDFLAAFCVVGVDARTVTGRRTECKSWILHQNLLVSFRFQDFNLHLVDEIGEALVGKLEEWRVRPESGS